MQKLRRLSFLLIGLLSLVTTVVFAQEYSFQQIGVEDGLSQSVATSISQDNEGGMWIGTMSGLTYYNGNQLIVYTEKDGLAEDWVTASFLDKNGNTWFGHWGGGVSVCEADTIKFRDLEFERYSQFKSITDIIQDKNGNIWFSTAGAGLFIYEVENQTIVTLTESDGFPANVVHCLEVDNNQNIWIGTDKGIVIYDVNKRIESEGAFSVVTLQDGLSASVINDLVALNNGSILASTPFDGLNRITMTDGLALVEYMTTTEGLPSNKINCILQDRQNNIWIGSRDAGVTKYDDSRGSFQQFSTRQGLSYFNIQSLFQDKENNIWIGTDLGVNLFKGEQFMIYNERDGLINNVVWSVAGDQAGNIWVGTNQGLSKINQISSSVNQNQEVSINNYGVKDGLSNEIILSVFPDNDGTVWCGTGFGGVNVLQNNRFRVIDTADGLASNTVFSVEKDSKGNFWFGTSEGASMYDNSSGEIRNFDEKDGLGGKHVYKIFNDSKNRLWFSVLGGHLSYLENGKFVVMDSSKGLSEKFITCITEDKEGNIWFGAYGSGLIRYDGNEFTTFNSEDGLSSNFPYSVVADQDNNLWIGTSRGVDQLNPNDNIFRKFSRREGFMGIEPNPNAVYKDKAGNVWFGTIMGVARFDLSKSRINEIPPTIRLSGIKINHVPTAYPAGGAFQYAQNNVIFEFLGISMTNPQHVKYSYILEGFDAEWSPITSSGIATYSNLPPGDFNFKVKAANSDGVWSEASINLPLTVVPPFWMTWTFYAACLLLAIFVLYYGDKLRTRNLKIANARLEEKVQERTKELAGKNRDILDSIRYAKRIQRAILPSETLMKKHLPNSFVFYQPKDIVSGDFYWMETVGNKVLFAAADCTGHGVPGAFMSIIGHNGLNKVVKENGIVKPSEILNKLSEIVESTLQYSDELEISDGLDIAICSLDKDKMELEYAGAYNPLYLVRDGELLETKADRSPVGGSPIYKEVKREFENHKLTLKKNDSLYIFSDGVPDQFGGPRGRKYRYKQFKELIVKSHAQPMDKQRDLIESTIEEWMGTMDQIDDMVVMGVKIV